MSIPRQGGQCVFCRISLIQDYGSCGQGSILSYKAGSHCPVCELKYTRNPDEYEPLTDDELKKLAKKYHTSISKVCRYCREVAPLDIEGDNQYWKCSCGRLSMIYHSTTWDIP